jgi:hexosaminidase
VDDQGWRIEIQGYPKLTEIGAWRPNLAARLNYLPNDRGERYGGFHTREDLREIVAYAAQRHVTIVPEVEMPGHTLAALMAYPELSCTGGDFPQLGDAWIYKDVYCPGNEKTFEFLEGMFSELLDLFPSPWIHIGGDECPKDRWKACPKCQARIRQEGLADEHELQSYFVRRIEQILHDRGRRLVGWDEILEGGLAPRATVQSWRGTAAGVRAAKAGHDVVMSPTSHCYLDYTYQKTPVQKTYSFDPVPSAIPDDKVHHILGVECCMWLGNVSTRHLARTGQILPPSGIDHQMFPRAIALSEVAWSPREARQWSDFRERLQRHAKRLELRGVNFARDGWQ